jgi:glycosyltransferase involved in cell wall biosynthesis
MIVMTTFYNAENYIENCVQSLLNQDFKNFKCYLIDDCSTDNSSLIAKKLIAGDNRFELIINSDRKYKNQNYYNILNLKSEIDENDVVVELDGDDWLSNDEVLFKINKVYSNNNIWITNGSFKYLSGHMGFSMPQIDFENLRKSRFTASHLRTWRVFLWRAIKIEDHKDDFDEFLKVNADLAYMLPMLEMASSEHYRFVPDVCLIYNDQNPINDHKVDLDYVNLIADKIRKRKKYKKLVR